MTKIRRAQAGDMPAAAGIVNAWIDETAWMPRVHPPDDVIRFYRDVVFENKRVWVAENDGCIVGLMALDGSMISALYLGQNARRQGLGSQLIELAKQASAAELTLWTFVANRAAQQFYAVNGFQEVRRTDGDNEEGLPDILFKWQPKAGA